MNDDTAIIAVRSGTKELSKRFVSRVRELGYECQKINPARAEREVVRIFLPRGHERDAEFFAASRNFIRSQEADYFYVEKKLQEFFIGGKQVAILVNISSELLEALESDFEAFSVSLSTSDGALQEAMSEHSDYTIFDNDEFNDRTDKLLRVLTKDMSNKDVEDAILV